MEMAQHDMPWDNGKKGFPCCDPINFSSTLYVEKNPQIYVIAETTEM